MFKKKNIKQLILGLAAILIGIGVTSQVASAKANPAYKLFAPGYNTTLNKQSKVKNPLLRLTLNKDGKKYYMIVSRFDSNDRPNYSTILSKIRVTKALYKNKTYYFYSKTSSKAIPSKKVRKSGKYKYRLAVKNTGKIKVTPFYISESDHKGMIGKFYDKVYIVNGKKYLAHYKTKQWGDR